MIAANLHNYTPSIMNWTICERCNAQLQIPLIDEINLQQHQQSKSCKVIAAKIKTSANQFRITSLLRHMYASPAASDATAAAVQLVMPISSPSSTSGYGSGSRWWAWCLQIPCSSVPKMWRIFAISASAFSQQLGFCSPSTLSAHFINQVWGP